MKRAGPPASDYEPYIEYLRRVWLANLNSGYQIFEYDRCDLYFPPLTIITAIYLPMDICVAVDVFRHKNKRIDLLAHVQNYEEIEGTKIDSILEVANSVPGPLLGLDHLRDILEECHRLFASEGEDRINVIDGRRKESFYGKLYKRYDRFYPCIPVFDDQNNLDIVCSRPCKIFLEGWELEHRDDEPHGCFVVPKRKYRLPPGSSIVPPI